jgi:hypothetical protein
MKNLKTKKIISDIEKLPPIPSMNKFAKRMSEIIDLKHKEKFSKAKRRFNV